jgi:hypothetical protein
MRTLPSSMQASLESGVTTFCRCWLLVRTDGVKLGFTDHDRDVTFDGVNYEALAGITASAINATNALNIDTTDIAGALQSDHLNEADLAAGLYDNAALTLYLVDWSNPADRDIAFAGSIGEVSRSLNVFKAEMRGDELVRMVPVAEPVARYAVEFVRGTRSSQGSAPDFIKKYVNYGASVRAAQFLVLAAKARALSRKRYNVAYEDIQALAVPILRHRVLLNFQAESEKLTTDDLLKRLLEHMPPPRG